MFNKEQMNQFMEEAKKMQGKMQEMQDKITGIKEVGESGAGLVKITMAGNHEVQKVQLDDSLLDVDEKEMLEDLLVAAFNSANKKIEEASSKNMAQMAQSMINPDMLKSLNLPFGGNNNGSNSPNK